MRRDSVLVSVLAVVLVGWVAFGRGTNTVAQDATPGATEVATVEATAPPAAETAPAEPAGAPSLVGVWLLDTDADDPENAPEVAAFTADGVYVSVDAEQAASVGVWAATGDQTAVLTIVSPGVEDDEEDEDADEDEGEGEGEFAGTFTIRAAIEVDASGNSFTAQYTFEVVDADGTSSGQFGPGTATATRLTAEGPGEPVGPLSELFEQFEGTPAP